MAVGVTITPSASAETSAPYPQMELAQRIHRLLASSRRTGIDFRMTTEAGEVFEKIANELKNPTLYRWLQLEFLSIQPDAEQLLIASTAAASKPVMTSIELDELVSQHEAKIRELEAKVEQAKESAGDMEVMESRLELARFASQSLSYEVAMQMWRAVIDLPKISSGKQIDCYMEMARVASFYRDKSKADECIEKADRLSQDGGDWDRRNRLKVYKALQALLHRNLQKASELFLDCVATFSCLEMCTYPEFIVYAILTNLLYLPRPELKKRIIDGPEILSVAPDIPVLLQLVRSYYDCDYKAYLHAMVELESILLADRYLHPHTAYWMRELHILAYKQFLDSYQSVTLAAMAAAFGVSIDFVDYHASRFIAANRLSAKIDKYGGVIVTNRPDFKNAQYREMIHKGDLLLNRIQKLSRVVDL